MFDDLKDPVGMAVSQCTLCQLCGKIAGQWAKQWGQSAICHLSGKRAWEFTANNSGGEAAKPWHVN